MSNNVTTDNVEYLIFEYIILRTSKIFNNLFQIGFNTVYFPDTNNIIFRTKTNADSNKKRKLELQKHT